MVIGTTVSLHIAKSNASRETSETITFRTSDGTAEMSRIVIGLPLTGMRNRCARISAISSRTDRLGAKMKA